MRKHSVAAAVVAAGLAATAAPAHASDADTARLGGVNRYETAAKISADIFNQANGMTAPFVQQVTVASAFDFPDGLAAGATAPVVGSPLLLVPSTGVVPSAVVNEIRRLGAEEIAIAGGPGSVSADVEAQLKAIPGISSVIRVAGTNRYETAVELSQVLTTAPTVYLVNGQQFPDALASSAAAGSKDGSLLLVTQSGLPAVTKAELQRLRPTKVVAVGGPTVVSDTVLGQVRAALPNATVTRTFGANRYDTSAKISAGAFTTSDIAYFASGEDFPDGLAGGAAGALDGAPLLLSRKDCVPQSVLAEVKRLGVKQFFVLGGTGTLSQKVIDRVPCAG